MPGTTRPSAPVTRLVLLGAVLVIVLGILGMHALSHPGTAREPAPTVATASATDMTGAMSADAGHPHARHQAEAARRSAPAHDTHGTGRGDAGGTGHSLGDMVMLCVAMLAAAATLLALLAFLRRVPRLWAVLRPAVTHFCPTSWLAPMGTGPPSVWQFSVIRC